MTRTTGILFALISLLFSGCSSPDGEIRPCLLGNGQCQTFVGQDGELPTENNGTDLIDDSNTSNFVCIATPRKSTVNHQEILALDIEVRGGAAPYNIYRGLTYPIESFSSRTTLLGYYTNTSSSSEVAQRTVYIKDSSGTQTHCNFTVTVRPQFSNSNLACTITPDQQVVAAGTQVKFTLEGTGGTDSTYTFKDFSPKSGWTVDDGYIQSVDSTKSEISIIYQTSAVRYPEVLVTNGGETASCRTAVFVGTTTPGGYYGDWDWTHLPPWWGWGGVPYLPPGGGYYPPYPDTSPLPCDIQAGPNPGLVGTLTEVVASVPSYTGSGNYEVSGYTVTRLTDGAASLVDRLDAHTPGDPLKQILRFRRPGGHYIRATVRDINTGRTGQCQTYYHARPARYYRIGTGHGRPAHARTYLGGSTTELLETTVFGGTTTRANHTAQADVTGDGVSDILVSQGPKSGASHRVQVLDGTNRSVIFDFDPLPSHGGDGGSWIAGGDVNGDGHADILVGQDGGPWVKIYDGSSSGTSPTLKRGLRPYGTSYTGGIRVASGDVDGDGYSDLITIPGEDLAKAVKVYSGKTLFSGSLTVIATLHPFAKSGGGYYGFEPGGFVSAGDINGDGYADIVTSLDRLMPGMSSADYTANAEIYDGYELQRGYRVLIRTISNPNGNHWGTTTAVGDVDGDGYGEIIVTSARDCNGRIRIYEQFDTVPFRNFEAYSGHFNHGLFPGAGTGGL